jgi:hypothetical protein
MESMPFLHANRLFKIIFAEDLTFAAVREILDLLLARDAFNPETQENVQKYSLEVDTESYDIWVSDMDVYIVRV